MSIDITPPSLATPVAPNLGGTGVANNAASTLTISGNFGTTFTVSGATALTLPTSGTLVTTATLNSNTLAASVTTLSVAGGLFTIDSGGNITAAAQIAANSNILCGLNSAIGINGRAYLVATAPDLMQLWNSTFNGCPLLQFGGATSSFPAIKRSATTLQVRLADDSGAAAILASNIPVVDTGWTANADAGSKTASIPSSATLATIQTGLNLAVAGSGDALAATAAKVKAIETTLVALLLPNA